MRGRGKVLNMLYLKTKHKCHIKPTTITTITPGRSASQHSRSLNHYLKKQTNKHPLWVLAELRLHLWHEHVNRWMGRPDLMLAFKLSEPPGVKFTSVHLTVLTSYRAPECVRSNSQKLLWVVLKVMRRTLWVNWFI